MPPDASDDAEPVLKDTEPLDPSEPDSAEPIFTSPLEVVLLEPLNTRTDPLIPIALPDTRFTSPDASSDVIVEITISPLTLPLPDVT